MTTTKIGLGMKEFMLFSRLKKSGVPFPNAEKSDELLHNHFEIEVHNVEGGECTVDHKNVNNKFDWYDSHTNFKLGKVEMSEEDMKYAFRQIIEDAINGLVSFKEFCSEFGYDEDSRRAERIHKQCQMILKKVQNIGIHSDLYEVVNQFSEMGIE